VRTSRNVVNVSASRLGGRSDVGSNHIVYERKISDLAAIAEDRDGLPSQRSLAEAMECHIRALPRAKDRKVPQ
jgi:hypothetical protein